MRGRFVAFEGIDGSGKSSALQAAAAAFPDAFVTREETSSPYGDLVRFSIEQHAPPLTTAHLFLADRAQHVVELERRLRAGQTVLCDRYLHSTLAYQGVTLEGHVSHPMEYLRTLHAPITLRPDRVFLFDVDAATAVERTKERGATTPYEKVAFLAKVAQRYRELAANDPSVVVIDAGRPQEEVAADVTRRLGRFLTSHNEVV